MSYKVSHVNGEPNFDSLPVAKVAVYPLEPRDYRPFAQHIMCVSDTCLHLRMWAFEVNPLPGSRLECVAYLFEKAPDTALAVVAVPTIDNNPDVVGCCLLKDGSELPVSPALEQKLQSINVHPHNGEDLQGAYWGCTIDIPLPLLEEWSGKTFLATGKRFPGNFYKICVEEPQIHLGSWHEANFNSNPYLLESMGEFEVVEY